MKFEVLKQSHLKRNIIIGVVAVLIISAIVLTFTRARYRVTESIPLVNGTINYNLPDIQIIGLYIDGKEAEELDSTKSYTLDTINSTCTYKDGTTIDNLTLSYDSNSKTFTIAPYTTKGTKCTLYFDEKILIADTILAGTNSPQEHTVDWTNNGTGITYYYTENPNNWLYFAGYYWRIIRINGNKTIRIIYQGANANATGSGTQIGTKAFNNAADYSEYVGFKYTLNKPNGTDTNSTILGENTTNDTTTLNGWYRVYLLEYETYIDKNTGFCGDRNIAYGTGMGTTETYYIAHYRITAENSPSLLCNNQDVYTTTDSNTGNQSLTYPIGLITADEVALAGGQQSSGDNFYLATGQDYWTMTPDFYPSHAIVFRISSVGYIDNNESVSETSGVRPVINLSADVTISSGNGTSSNPYVIAT